MLTNVHCTKLDEWVITKEEESEELENLKFRGQLKIIKMMSSHNYIYFS